MLVYWHTKYFNLFHSDWPYSSPGNGCCGVYKKQQQQEQPQQKQAQAKLPGNVIFIPKCYAQYGSFSSMDSRKYSLGFEACQTENWHTVKWLNSNNIAQLSSPVVQHPNWQV